MDANIKAASDAVAQLSLEKKDLLAKIERQKARVLIIDAQLEVLQPLAKAAPGGK